MSKNIIVLAKTVD